VNQQENGQGNNGDLPARRRSGFGDPNWWNTIDPETGLTQREKKKQWAAKMVAEGRIGGARPGAGRPRKNKPVAEVVTEKASEKGEKIASKLLDLALNHKAPSVNLGAIDRLNKYEQDYEKNLRDDEKELRKLSGPELEKVFREEVLEKLGYDYELSPEDVEEEEEDA
jgi:hypothetical protein